MKKVLINCISSRSSTYRWQSFDSCRFNGNDERRWRRSARRRIASEKVKVGIVGRNQKTDYKGTTNVEENNTLGIR